MSLPETLLQANSQQTSAEIEAVRAAILAPDFVEQLGPEYRENWNQNIVKFNEFGVTNLTQALADILAASPELFAISIRLILTNEQPTEEDYEISADKNSGVSQWIYNSFYIGWVATKQAGGELPQEALVFLRNAFPPAGDKIRGYLQNSANPATLQTMQASWPEFYAWVIGG